MPVTGINVLKAHHVVAGVRIFFLFVAEWYFTTWVDCTSHAPVGEPGLPPPCCWAVLPPWWCGALSPGPQLLCVQQWSLRLLSSGHVWGTHTVLAVLCHVPSPQLW